MFEYRYAFTEHPLPVPQLVPVSPLRKSDSVANNIEFVISKLLASVERGAQVFVFVPNIQLVEPMVNLLKGKLNLIKSGVQCCVSRGLHQRICSN